MAGARRPDRIPVAAAAWVVFCASLTALAVLVARSLRHPVLAVAAAPSPGGVPDPAFASSVTGAVALEAMAEALRRHDDTDITVELAGRELDSIEADRALARERASSIIDRLVALGPERGRFVVRLRPAVTEAGPGQRVRVIAECDGA